MRRSRRIFYSIIIIVAALLVGARLYLPTWLKNYVNRTLDKIPGYHGHVDEIDVHLWRGAYSIINPKLLKTSGKVPVPFFSASSVDLSVEWRQLFHGAMVGEIELERPKLNFVNAEDKANKQTGIHPSWQKAVRDLFPLRINSFRGNSGEIHFRDFERSPKVDVYVNDVFIEAKNLTNSEKISKTLMASISARGLASGEAPLSVKVDLNPFQENPAFKLDGSLKRLSLPRLNDFFKAYAFVDVEGGEFELYTELESDGSKFEGYVKPFLKDIHILDLRKDVSNPFKLVWESFVGLLAEVFENQSKEQIASKIPISGRYKSPKTDMWEAIGSLLYNAFFEALRPGIESGLKGDKK